MTISTPVLTRLLPSTDRLLARDASASEQAWLQPGSAARTNTPAPLHAVRRALRAVALDVDLSLPGHAAASPPAGQIPLLAQAPDSTSTDQERPRIALQVSAYWQGELTKALLDIGLQPVMLPPGGTADQRGRILREAAASIVEFHDLQPPPPHRTLPALIALLSNQPGDSPASLRRQAMEAGALSLIDLDAQRPQQAQEVAQVASRLLRELRAAACAPAPKPTNADHRQAQLARRLRMASGAGDLSLRYQPQVDLYTGALTGAEALLRWTDAELGDVSPAEFIPLAEAQDLIDPISDWVLQECCRQLRRWKARGVDMPRLSINIARSPLEKPDFADRVLATLSSHELSPTQLALEISASIFLPAPVAAPSATHDSALAQLRRLRIAGVQIAMDDFCGEGGSLRELHQLPLDEIKINRQLLSRPAPEGNTLVAAIIALAHSLRLRVVAVGVEDEDQLEQLRLQQCDEFQGFLIAEALVANTMGDVLAGAAVQHRIVAAPMPPAPTSSNARDNGATLDWPPLLT